MNVHTTLLAILLITLLSAVYCADFGTTTNGNETIIRSPAYALRFYQESPSIALHPTVEGYPMWKRWITSNFTYVREVTNKQDSSSSPVTVVKTISMTNLTWTRVFYNMTLDNGETVECLNFTTSISNGAKMMITFITANGVSNGSSIQYGHLDYPLNPDGIKLSIWVENWPFANASNWLQVRVAYALDSGAVGFLDPDASNPDFLVGVLQTPKTSLTMRLVSYSISDGVEQGLYPFLNTPKTQIFLQGTFDYTWQSPSFKNYFYYDPDFSILFSTAPNCNNLQKCNNHGTCVEDNECICDGKWEGDDCATCNTIGGCDDATPTINENLDNASQSKKNGAKGLTTAAIAAIACVSVAVVAVIIGVVLISLRFRRIHKNRAALADAAKTGNPSNQ